MFMPEKTCKSMSNVLCTKRTNVGDNIMTEFLLIFSNVCTKRRNISGAVHLVWKRMVGGERVVDVAGDACRGEGERERMRERMKGEEEKRVN
jgi:hypothetical protein